MFEFRPELVDDDDDEADDTQYADKEEESDEEQVILKSLLTRSQFERRWLPPEQTITSHSRWLFSLTSY